MATVVKFGLIERQRGKRNEQRGKRVGKERGGGIGEFPGENLKRIEQEELGICQG